MRERGAWRDRRKKRDRGTIERSERKEKRGIEGGKYVEGTIEGGERKGKRGIERGKYGAKVTLKETHYKASFLPQTTNPQRKETDAPQTQPHPSCPSLHPPSSPSHSHSNSSPHHSPHWPRHSRARRSQQQQP